MSEFKIKKSKSDEFYFVFSASNGETVVTSEMYKSKQSAYTGIKSLIVGARNPIITDASMEVKVEEIEVVEPVVVAPKKPAPKKAAPRKAVIKSIKLKK